ncbi:hypothetical protein TNCV_3170351 [Trichonephila clavipes]|nr:hypothetical protein TNCV_3170351 [Trichonephila clavipes]
MISDLHDNVHPHASREIQTTAKMLEHSPYSPNSSPKDFHSLRLFKRALCFHLDDEMKEAVQDYFKNQPRYSYNEGIDLLSK